jgi:2-polyprenyl-6-methoxyphenol hydroxylase-like FAD-dependent oxidoreductase
MTRRLGTHAVVLGAGIGGLLAARVLADSYDRVTVVERDRLPDTTADRRGTPQGRHVHALLTRGAMIMDELFPGLLDELADHGAQVLTDYTRLHFAPDGHRFSPRVSGLPPVQLASRPFLEAHVRERVRALPAVDLRDGHDVAGLTATASRVTGVRIQRRGAAEETLAADLVVDCLGRGARTPVWLAELGYPQPVEEQVRVNVRYTSTRLRLRHGSVPEQLVFIGPTADRPTTVALFAYEDDVWQFSVSGYAGHHARPDLAGMLEFAAACAPPHIVAALGEAEQLSEVVSFTYPASRRRRYDRLRRFPAGLLVFGDAMCGFNPVYGQGMSVAALEAVELRRCLRHGEKNLARRFFRAAARPIDVAWQLAVSGDLALPQIEAPRPLPMRLVNAYVKRLLATAEHDPAVARAFLRVNMFLDRPPALMRPSVMARVIAGPRPVSGHAAGPERPRTAENAALSGRPD